MTTREDNQSHRATVMPDPAPRQVSPYPLSSLDATAGRRTIIHVGGRSIGGRHFSLIAGPCSVESRAQLLDSAAAVSDAGGHFLRGGAYKPRTSPYSFQGLGVKALELLSEARERTGLPIVTELLDTRHLTRVCEVADIIQVGARNMQNYALLSELGRTDRPILLKRGLAATLDELLLAAEYILKEGNANVILCERGIRTFESAYRFTLDLTGVAVLKTRTHLPVLVDPSHAAGRRDLVHPLSMAAAAVGADGIIVEVHPRPAEALCDGAQALHTKDLPEFVRQLTRTARSVGKLIEGGQALRRAV
jgi:3-deoxy-7-phosphoheptulonate synthase